MQILTLNLISEEVLSYFPRNLGINQSYPFVIADIQQFQSLSNNLWMNNQLYIHRGNETLVEIFHSC